MVACDSDRELAQEFLVFQEHPYVAGVIVEKPVDRVVRAQEHEDTRALVRLARPSR